MDQGGAEEPQDTGAGSIESAPQANQDQRLLFQAAVLGDEEAVQNAFSSGSIGADAKQTALHLAVVKGHKHLAGLLLNSGAEVNIPALDITEQEDNSWLARFLQENIPGDATPNGAAPPLHLACLSGDVAMVQVLLDHKADIDRRDGDKRTPLLCAVAAGKIEVVEMLLKRGANAKIPLPDSTTAEDLAAGNADMLQRLRTKVLLSGPQTERREKPEKDVRFAPPLLPPPPPLDDQHRQQACRGFEATVTEFYVNEAGEKRLDATGPVYDLLYGPGPSALLRQAREDLVGGREPSFRWIHLPANNMAWVEVLMWRIYLDRTGSITKYDDKAKNELGLFNSSLRPMFTSKQFTYLRPVCRTLLLDQALRFGAPVRRTFSVIPYLHYETNMGYTHMSRALAHAYNSSHRPRGMFSTPHPYGLSSTLRPPPVGHSRNPEVFIVNAKGTSKKKSHAGPPWLGRRSNPDNTSASNTMTDGGDKPGNRLSALFSSVVSTIKNISARRNIADQPPQLGADLERQSQSRGIREGGQAQIPSQSESKEPMLRGDPKGEATDHEEGPAERTSLRPLQQPGTIKLGVDPDINKRGDHQASPAPSASLVIPGHGSKAGESPSKIDSSESKERHSPNLGNNGEQPNKLTLTVIEEPNPPLPRRQATSTVPHPPAPLMPLGPPRLARPSGTPETSETPRPPRSPRPPGPPGLSGPRGPPGLLESLARQRIRHIIQGPPPSISWSGVNLNESLICGYLFPRGGSRSSLQPRRTLDQYFYQHVESTSQRDQDQVVSRYTRQANQMVKLFMVDQMWMWVLSEDTIITCCPLRWWAWSPFNPHHGPRERPRPVPPTGAQPPPPPGWQGTWPAPPRHTPGGGGVPPPPMFSRASPPPGPSVPPPTVASPPSPPGPSSPVPASSPPVHGSSPPLPPALLQQGAHQARRDTGHSSMPDMPGPSLQRPPQPSGPGRPAAPNSRAAAWPRPIQNDPLNIQQDIVRWLRETDRPLVDSVHRLASIIAGACVQKFDPHRTHDMFQFFDFFEWSISRVVDKANDCLVRFRESLQEQAELNIIAETELLVEAEDILDELRTLKLVLNDQEAVVEDMHSNMFADAPRPSWAPESLPIEPLKVDTRVLQNHLSRIAHMELMASKAKDSLYHIMDLKQKQANLSEALSAREQAKEAAKQGLSIVVFTVVTIIFLPISFIAAVFTISADAWPTDSEGKVSLTYVIKYILGIGLSLSMFFIFLALNLDKVSSWFSKNTSGLTRYVQSMGILVLGGGLVATPFIVIWTSTLAGSVKSAATVCIAMLLLIGSVWWGFDYVSKRMEAGTTTVTTASSSSSEEILD